MPNLPQSLQSIKWSRLILVIVVTFLVADTYPHPNLPPGVLQSTWSVLVHSADSPTYVFSQK